MEKPLAALTGATGFLGRHVAEALAGAGWRLRALSRGSQVPDSLSHLQPEVVAGRLADPAALEQLVEGAQAVIHIAGLIKARRPAELMVANADGARTVALAADRRAPDARFVLVSSLSARTPVSAYGASKAAGEAAVREVLGADRITIVRPPAIYGPGDLETLALFQAAQIMPFLPRVGPEAARFAVIHASDAAGQIAAAAAGSGRGGVWSLADRRPEGYGWRELLLTAAAAVGRRPAILPLPRALVLGLGEANTLLGRLGAPVQILSNGKARELLYPDWGVASEELLPDGPPIRFDLTSGFADVVDWYRAHGWLKGQTVLTASPQA